MKEVVLLKNEFINSLNIIESNLHSTIKGYLEINDLDEVLNLKAKVNVIQIFTAFFEMVYYNLDGTKDADDIYEEIYIQYTKLINEMKRLWESAALRDRACSLIPYEYREELKVKTAESINNIFISHYNKHFKC